MGSNLPPGVTEGMIPGNRPEDIEFERLIEDAILHLEDAVENSAYLDKRDIPDILGALYEFAKALYEFAVW